MSAVLEFLEFIEQPGNQSVRDLLDRVLLKARQMTGAEAGSIFIVRKSGKQDWLVANSIQNDKIKLSKADFRIPVVPTSIAGYVASTAETVLIDDLYAIPKNVPFDFDRSFDESSGYRSRSMLAFPLTNFQKKVIGVVQLINRRKGKKQTPATFDDKQADLILPFNQIVGRIIERADMLEQINKRNADLRSKNKTLRAQQLQIEELQQDTEEAFMVSIRLLARAAEVHDEDTGNHIIRCNEYAFLMAKKCGMPDDFCKEIHHSAQLHDIGKMSVNSAILTKPGRLDDDERHEMNEHTTYGYQILSRSDRLQMAAEIAHSHHEQWDGSGYPRGLSGEQIPMSARILGIADIYDALRSERAYKPAFSHEKTFQILTVGDDRLDPTKHFDPKLLAVFKENHEEFNQIRKRLED
ncbi:MAG: HD domain-containing protein [Rhodospirillaceae bacterium]|jgi:HD-GYP domain-containing protein (c-di-GMP phosphodiesterase class II)|nr:HD domain-containing protein [Rhodospirillaceae bacterium]MBT5677794.1 HD domain-containing protein [Rhodospirillaceae bacterium]